MNDYKARLHTDRYGATIDAPVIVNVVTAEHYAGPYSVTPSGDAQTLETAAKHMDGDVVVAPIPPNYGRIAWNGVTLSVY